MSMPKREQLKDYWPIYHPQQSALKIEFLIALQMAKALAIDTVMLMLKFPLTRGPMCVLFQTF